MRRRGGVGVLWVSLAAATLLSACGTSSTTGTASSTSASTSIAAPVATTTTTAVPMDVRSVDWQNITVPGQACMSTTPIMLVSGKALIPDAQHGNATQPGGTGPKYDALATVGTPAFGDVEGPGPGVAPDDAAVSLSCTNNGGTASGALLYSIAVFSVRGGSPHAIGLVTPHQQTTGQPPTLLEAPTMSAGSFTVTEDWYGANDPTCCPSGRASSTWHVAGGQLTYGSTMVTTTPH